MPTLGPRRRSMIGWRPPERLEGGGVTRCLLCPWQIEGNLAAGRRAYTQHRRHRHPHLMPVTREARRARQMHS
jgi:hypothetical protein